MYVMLVYAGLILAWGCARRVKKMTRVYLRFIDPRSVKLQRFVASDMKLSKFIGKGANDGLE